MAMTIEQQLTLVSKAWGKQSGYAFFPRISGQAKNKEERIQSYKEGPAFLWPRDKAKIIKYLEQYKGDDVYWCPSLFERKRRRLEDAMDEHCLWADLDETDPRSIEDYEPTIAWETSPGRYQCLWLIGGGYDIQGASWQGGENQKMTYYVGADVGGWDTTQLMRFPEWPNYKPEYRDKNGEAVVHGRLLWKNGRRYLPDDFSELPEVPRAGEFEDILEDQIDSVDTEEVWARVRLKVSRRTRELLKTKVARGERSDTLWSIERDLADAGCTAVEIVAIVRGCAWNKYVGRADELKRLTIEAGKAIAERPDKIKQGIEEDREGKPQKQKFFSLLATAKPPRWLVRNIWTQGACGFIAGQPKSWKSWIALDLALSVSTGSPFLGQFKIQRSGPVLYIQEEDSLPTLKSRNSKMWEAKQSSNLVNRNGQVMWEPMSEPKIDALVGGGFQLSDDSWSLWLDEALESGYVAEPGAEAEPYIMLMLDPLMMIMGDVEENRAADMTDKIFRPLKLLARKYDLAVCLVHHMRKGQSNEPQRGGQLMLGSVANHAWAEDALYVRHSRGALAVEFESKSAPEGKFNIVNLRNRSWEPRISRLELIAEGDGDGSANGRARRPSGATGKHRAGRRPSRIPEFLNHHGPATVADIATGLGISKQSAAQQLGRLVDTGSVSKNGTQWIWVKS